MASAPRPRWSDVVILMVGMGVAVTIAWFAFSEHRSESYTLDPSAILRPSRLMVYATQFLLVAGFAFWLTRGRMRDLSPGQLAAAALAGWVGEGIVLTIIGAPLVANELDPEIAWYYWLVATAGPLQPAVAILAGWLGLRTESASP